MLWRYFARLPHRFNTKANGSVGARVVPHTSTATKQRTMATILSCVPPQAEIVP